MREDQDLDDVGEVMGHADDVDAGGFRAEELDGTFEDANGADDVAGLGCEGVGQLGRGRGEDFVEEMKLFLLGERGVVGRDVDGLEDFRHGRFVPHGMLAQVEPRDAEAEKRDLLA